MNLFPAHLERGSLRIGADAFENAFPSLKDSDQSVQAGIRPGDLEVCAQGGLAAEVEFVEDFGDSAIVNLSIAGQRAKMRTERRELPAEGTRLRVAPRAGSIHLFSQSNGARLHT
jgi:ABC-type sugar transport system ATPase subunit